MRVGIALRCCFALVSLLAAAQAVAADAAVFQRAKPVWPAGREKEMNLQVGFRAVIEKPAKTPKTVMLRVAAASFYRATVNGRFVAAGPARAAHGFYRIDELDIASLLHTGRNVVAIEVAGYNVNGFYLLDQPSFCQAEVVCGDRVLAATAADAAGGAEGKFTATVLDYRLQKVQRYSFSRPFIEFYRIKPGWDAWRRDPAATVATARLAEQPGGQLLPRGVLYPEYAVLQPVGSVAAGTIERRAKIGDPWIERSLATYGPAMKGYPREELAADISEGMQHFRSVAGELLLPGDPRFDLAASTYRIVDLGRNLTGFLGLRITCAKKTWLAVVFDEVLSHGDVDFKRLGCVNVVTYKLEPGTYEVETLEPYTLRYAKLMCLEGQCRIDGFFLREFAHPPTRRATFISSDRRLNWIYDAAVLTFRENALDIFMDCPSRERGGYLCDGFFTARAAADLTGTTRVERCFLENYSLPKKFAFLPEDMLPMCYPADHNDGLYIPNWALWLVVQLGEYADRSGDQATVEALRPRVLKLMKWFTRYENSDGLLEKLPGWVFVEWSKANEFVQDVNYPSNMLYAASLSVAGRLYRLPELQQKADRIRAVIRKQSFDGRFFVDNAVRRNGKLEVTRNRSEVCQYFAFFFGVADFKRDAELWETLRDDFGPTRVAQRKFVEVCPANSFVGNVLRLELLSQAGCSQQIIDESVDYLLYMATRTGTLWENVSACASCNHGFQSHAVHLLYRDVLGLRKVDPMKKEVVVRIPAVELKWCEGERPTPDGGVRLRWWHEGEGICYRLSAPKGYRVEIENASGRPLVARP
jgi:alpha-L-rhamnosidase